MCCCRQLWETPCFLQGIIDGTQKSLIYKLVLRAKNMAARSVGRPWPKAVTHTVRVRWRCRRWQLWKALEDSIHGPVLYIFFLQNRECYMQVPGAMAAGAFVFLYVSPIKF